MGEVPLELASLPSLGIEERMAMLEGRMLDIEKRCILLGISTRGGHGAGSRLSAEGRLAAQQLIRILNMTLSDTGFDATALKSWVGCTQIFEAEFTSRVNQLEPDGDPLPIKPEVQR